MTTELPHGVDVVVMDHGTLTEPDLAMLDAARRLPRDCPCPWAIPLPEFTDTPFHHPTGILGQVHTDACPKYGLLTPFRLVIAPQWTTPDQPSRPW